MAKRSASLSHQTGLSPDLPTSSTATPGASLSASSGPSLRITRSAARLAAESASTSSQEQQAQSNNSTNRPPPPPPAPTRKRKAPARPQRQHQEPEQPPSASPPRRTKRLKLAAQAADTSAAPPQRRAARNTSAMSQPGPSSRPSDNSSKTPASSSSAPRQRSSRSKKGTQDATNNKSSPPPPRRQRKRPSKRDSDVTMKEPDENENIAEKDERDTSPPSEPDDRPHPSGLTDDEEADMAPFQSQIFGSRSALGLHSTIRALSGIMSGMSSRLRDILTNLRMKEDPSIQLIALQELSDLLLVSNEDNLSGGQFSPDPYVKELVTLMQPNETGEENPEIMLLACRSLANLMEALRGSVANVVYGGAVPVLCQKLLDIQFIDLAEQALSTLAKISVDFPASIVREGGLTACLSYLDFFPTSTQRTAVTTAANCCRNIPPDSFPVIRDVMPTLLHVLSSNDQKVVEQGCLCVSRVVESFKYRPEKLEELIEPEMLKAVLRLLLPGTTNLIGPHIHTQFLRVLSITARSSPRLSVELLKMDVVDTLYQILTGVSPPSEMGNSIKVDSVHIMQALIHRPREQVFETLNVICELLPGVPNDTMVTSNDHLQAAIEGDVLPTARSPKAKASAEQRLKLLKECKPEIKRFATILLPTLTDTYSSTVNLGVRQKVLIAQLKMLQHLDAQIIEDALRTVPYASFLAAILSQKDHMSLVALALQCAELLFQRLQNIYQYQFHREGVITEITKLAETPLSAKESNEKTTGPGVKFGEDGHSEKHHGGSSDDGYNDQDSPESHPESQDYYESRLDEDSDDDDEDEHGIREEDEDDLSGSESSSIDGQVMGQTLDSLLQDLVTRSAREFLRIYENSKGKGMHDKALGILQSLQTLVGEIEACYKAGGSGDGFALFQKLASYFEGDALESITSAELLNSGIIRAILDVVGDSKASKSSARTDFVRAFMGTTVSPDSARGTSACTPLSVLIQKLHDLLSRTEHFEVVTVNHTSLEHRSAASMLSKQLRLRLVADEESDIPRPYKNMMVSIHAIANFKALDDYLRPRISLSERPRGSRNRDAVLSQLSGSSRPRDAENSGTDSHSTLASDSPFMAGSTRSQPNNALSRGARFPDRSRGELPASGQPSQSQDSADREIARRRNRHQPPPPGDESGESDEGLECLDERHLTDDDEGEEDEEDALDAYVEDFDDDMSDEEIHDPTAVNVEVGSGGKVTARKDDGTRVATPHQSTPAGRPSSSAPTPPTQSSSGNGNLALAGRPFAYAAALASMPQDWHIEFRVDDKPISSDTTIYRAIHHNRDDSEDSPSRNNVWTMTHTIKFKRVQGPPPAPSSTLTPNSSNLHTSTDSFELPKSLNKYPITGSILQLLRILHGLNAQLDDIVAEIGHPVKLASEPLSQFINTKLTAKLNRQLEEPLIVASSCLPSWSEDLPRLFPFLFPFETRHLFLQSTSFGYSRSMTRWQGSQSGDDNRRDHRRDDRPFIGRLQRQKVRISRSRILDSALKVMELYGSSPSVLEVEYFEEVGTGLGPTLEFYSTVSKEFSKRKLKLWREQDASDNPDYVYSKLGLFPAPMSREHATSDAGKKQLQYFKGLGKFVARSMLDSRIIDIHFNPTFFRIGGSSSSIAPSIGTIKSVDPGLANSLMHVKRFANAKVAIDQDPSLTKEQKEVAARQCEIDGVRVEDLGLDFTLPGYPNIQLVPHGATISVTMDNVVSYVDKVIDMTLVTGVRAQVDAFRTGFSQVFSYASLKAFTPNELVMLFGQVEEDWSIETLMDSIKADHGFNMDSRSVRNLLQTMSEFTLQQRRDFLQFVTGSPKLPIGGFKSLTPMFTVVCRPSEPPYTSDDYLPSVMTCVNYLKLPDYSSLDILKERLDVAIREGQGAFHLS